MYLPHYGNTESQKSVHFDLQNSKQDCSIIDAENNIDIFLAAYVSHQIDSILGKGERKPCLIKRNYAHKRSPK